MIQCLESLQTPPASPKHTEMQKPSLAHGKKEHITLGLKKLHWLPVKQRTDHKIMPLAYKCYEGTAPEYLQELIPRYVHARAFSHHRNHAY